MKGTKKLILVVALLMFGRANSEAQDKLYADKFPIGDVTLLGYPARARACTVRPNVIAI